MNVVEQTANLWLSLALWVAVAIALAVAFSYFWRKRVRELFEGGAQRYLLALVVQATAFMAPIPLVLLTLMRWSLPPGLDVLLAVCAGIAMVIVLRMLPVTGPLLRELQRARVEAVRERRAAKS
jgi:hypothetical protein